jgi:elongation factor Ts
LKNQTNQTYTTMSITAADVKALRDRTGAGMMDCRSALTEANGDMEAAVEVLRKKGQKVSEKRADREANQGIVVTIISDDKKSAIILSLNCETDFVARNEEFIGFANGFAAAAFAAKTDSIETINGLNYNGLPISKHLEDLVGKIGEKIEIARVAYLEGNGEIVAYNHPGNLLGVLLQFDGELKSVEAGRNVAMQIAAMNPIAVKRSEVPTETLEKELEIAKELLINEGKSPEMAEKAAQGKLRRFYEERVLLEQKFVKDNSVTIEQYLKNSGEPTVTVFKRVQLGA